MESDAVWMRLSKADAHYLNQKDWHGKLFMMRNYLKETNVCVCPQGYTDFECSTPLYKKCFINITEPAFYKQCENQKDTPYYLYSIQGYDPCYYLNFSKSHEI